MRFVDIKEVAKRRYGQAALRANSGGAASCCGRPPMPTARADATEAMELPE